MEQDCVSKINYTLKQIQNILFYPSKAYKITFIMIKL